MPDEQLSPQAQLLIEAHVRQEVRRFFAVVGAVLAVIVVAVFGWINSIATSATDAAVEKRLKSIDDRVAKMDDLIAVSNRKLGSIDAETQMAKDDALARVQEAVDQSSARVDDATKGLVERSRQLEEQTDSLFARANAVNDKLSTLESLLKTSAADVATKLTSDPEFVGAVRDQIEKQVLAVQSDVKELKGEVADIANQASENRNDLDNESLTALRGTYKVRGKTFPMIRVGTTKDGQKYLHTYSIHVGNELTAGEGITYNKFLRDGGPDDMLDNR